MLEDRLWRGQARYTLATGLVASACLLLPGVAYYLFLAAVLAWFEATAIKFGETVIDLQSPALRTSAERGYVRSGMAVRHSAPAGPTFTRDYASRGPGYSDPRGEALDGPE